MVKLKLMSPILVVSEKEDMAEVQLARQLYLVCLSVMARFYTVAVVNTQTATLLPIICEYFKPNSIVYTNTYWSHDVLDVSEFYHYWINHSKLFAKQ